MWPFTGPSAPLADCPLLTLLPRNGTTGGMLPTMIQGYIILTASKLFTGDVPVPDIEAAKEARQKASAGNAYP